MSKAPSLLDRHGLAALSALSGVGGLAYQLLYLRYLTTFFGDMFYVHLAVMGLFLFGFGLGAKYAARVSTRLAHVQILLGAFALLFPLLVTLYRASPLAQLFGDPVTQAIFSVLFLLAVPSILIGCSVPLFSAYLQKDRGEGDAFKTIYLLYNLGSAFSLLLVEFVLIRRWGIRASLALLGIGNVACGVFLLFRRSGSRIEIEEPNGSFRDTAALFFLSTGAAIFQSMYIKLCYRLFKAFRENFAICTAASVLCIALGTLLVRRFRLKLGTCVLLAGVLFAVVYTSYEPISRLWDHAYSQANVSWSGSIALKGLFALLLCSPYVFLGASIPALLLDERDIARRSGQLLFVSGLGNGFGLFVFGFVAHPHLGFFQIAWLFLACLVLTIILGAPGLFELERRNVAPAAAFVVMLVGVRIVSSFSDVLAYIPLEYQRTSAITQARQFKRGPDTLSYFRWNGSTWITYDDQLSISITNRKGLVNWPEVLSGVIPALVAPTRSRAMVLGLGSGLTGGTTATLFDHTDIVEISGASLDFARFNAAYDFDVMQNPRATVVHDDARRFLDRVNDRYDVIVNSIPSPEFFAAGKIYTHEFYELVKRALKDSGVYCLWFTPEEMTPAGIETLLQTLARSFTTCSLAVLTDGYYFASCSKDGASVAYRSEVVSETSELAALFRKHEIAPGIQPYLDTLPLTPNLLTPDPSAPINTDDLPVLEFEISERRHLDRVYSDPVTADPSAFHIAMPRSDSGDFVTHSQIMKRVSPSLYYKLYEPAHR